MTANNNDNQSPDYAGFNSWQNDPFLQHLVRALPQQPRQELEQYGAWAGRAETLKLGAMANNNPPELKRFDPKGRRLDEVDFHPSWHALMRKSIEAGLHASIWNRPKSEVGMHNLVRAAKFYMASGVEAGHLCPVTMTNASVPVLMKHEGLSREWMPKLLSDRYDPSSRPVSSKVGAMIGMGMTEREGGSDVNAALTSAAPLEGGVWRIDGQKWFMSAPMCDAFMVLAQTGEGLGCFMLPRILPDGSKNGLEFQRLKNKLGNRSNASSEVEFRESLGFLVGEPGRGVATIMEMVGLTRLDCAISSAGLMRASLAEAVHHCRHRSAFGNRLIDQPLMQRVLADMALDVAAASALVFRLARAFDKSGNDPEEAAYVRLMTPVIKYWVCKMAPSLIYEVLECLGGNGYIEEGNLARHYREAPLNAIWEGAGNIMCLDVLRVIGKSKSVLNAVLDGLENDLGDTNAAKTVDVIRSASLMTVDDPGAARILVEQLAYTAATAELAVSGFQNLTDTFKETRLGGLWRNTYGMLDNRHDARKIIDTLYPEW